MDVLFKREQTGEGIRGVRFRLWAKIDLDEQEDALIKKYGLDHAMLIEADETHLFRQAGGVAVIAGILVFGFGAAMFGMFAAFFLAVLAAGGAGFWWINEKRETIFVNDLIAGRNFKCKSVIELAKKEAWLKNAVAVLRQVMESSKNWGGTESVGVPVLSAEDANSLMLKL